MGIEVLSKAKLTTLVVDQHVPVMPVFQLKNIAYNAVSCQRSRKRIYSCFMR